uniref:Trans-1,2-dihydrobenzene-1,2-diol dehydrogenase n=1 Tax=Hucho hucho TaxID=62062 RepID=A0A4W5R8R6_9TELE
MATRWGICSAGKISHDKPSLLETTRYLYPFTIVAVAAWKLQDAQEYAKKHSIPQAYGSYEELARDPEIEVVYVGTIHPYHLPVGMLFMKAQKNVLCENPMAMNLREVALPLPRPPLLMLQAVWTRFFPASLEIERLLSQGEVVEVNIVKADFGARLMHVPRAVEKELGGGALLDISIYCLQFICMVYNGEKPECIQILGVLSFSYWGYPTSPLPIGDILLVLYLLGISS